MKVIFRVWLLVALLFLTACAQKETSPFKEMTISTGSQKNAVAVWNTARAWLLTHEFGVLEKPNQDTITYVMKKDQNIAVTLIRDKDRPSLVKIHVAERAGHSFGAESESTFLELTSVLKQDVKLMLQAQPE